MLKVVAQLRRLALIEGVSYLVLLFIAMPLKYGAGIDMAVKIAGWIHGVLFIWLCVLLLLARIKAKLPYGLGVTVFVASLIPFGTFFTDKPLKRFEATLPGA